MLPKMTPVSVEETYKSRQPIRSSPFAGEKQSTDFNSRFDTLETMRSDGVYAWAFDQFEITQSGEVQTEVLESIGSLVDQ